MSNGSDASATIGGFLLRVFSDPRLFRRGGIAVTCLILSTWLVVLLVFWTLRVLAPPLAIEVKESGAVVFSTVPSQKTGMFLLSANGGDDSPWVATGISIQKDQRVTVQASGKICLAFHRMRDSATGDSLPPLPWIDPNGLRDAGFPPRQIREEERERKEYRIVPGLAQGMLIGAISPSRPAHAGGDAFELGSHETFKAKADGQLWLTVNDIWLDPSRQEAYCGKTRHTPEQFQDRIVAKSYWNIWYDDNAGSFLVTIEVQD